MFCLKFLCLCLWTNLTLIKFIFVFCVFALVFSILWLFVQMSPFKRSALKGGSSKGKELVIDVDNLSPRSKRTRSTTEAFDPDKFKSYAVFQDYEIYFRDALLLVERAVNQASLLETKIPKWFATKDWNYLLSNLDDAYENLVKEFYANAIFEGDELKYWVRGKSFSVTPVYLAEILCIN